MLIGLWVIRFGDFAFAFSGEILETKAYRAFDYEF